MNEDIQLRFLQAQRAVKTIAVDDAARAQTDVEDLESELNLFARLRDEEAFDDWLNFGVSTTIDGGNKESVDAAEQPKVSASVQFPAKQHWSAFFHRSRARIHRLSDQLDREAQAFHFRGLQHLREQLEETNDAVNSWSMAAADQLVQQKLLGQACEGLSTALFGTAEALQRLIDISEQFELTVHEDVLEREMLQSKCLELLEQQREVSDAALVLKLSLASVHHFEALRPIVISRTSEIVEKIRTLHEHAAGTPFQARKDALDAVRDNVLAATKNAVIELDEIGRMPLFMEPHQIWLRQVLDKTFSDLQEEAMTHSALSLSEVHIGCTSEKTAQKIRTWVCHDGMPFSEVAFRQLRHDSLSIGLGLCISARYILDELGRIHDEKWGFAYM